ncbi:hypothetical protein DL96DRAFT_828998 [Flagelloscypha sp. PMI_526]|nr:hypothetical protein DL96DRAFT_828998 [Flagelloscypha sp. PMI_526]
MTSTATDEVGVPDSFSNSNRTLVTSQPASGLATNIRLPLEIIHRVFEHLLPHPLFIQSAFAGEYEGEPDVAPMDPLQYFRRSLLTCMLVNPSWALFIRKLLYQQLVFISQKQIAKFSTSLSFLATSLGDSPFHGVQEIHILAPLSRESLEHLTQIVRCIGDASQTGIIKALSYFGRLVLLNVRYDDLPSILEEVVQGDATPLKQAIPMLLSNASFANALEFLHITDEVLEQPNLHVTLPCLKEITLYMHAGLRYRPHIQNNWEGFPPGHWSLPILRSITIQIGELAGTFPGLPEDVTFLQFLQKHGGEVQHFMLDGFANGAALPSSIVPVSYLQPCLDLLPKLKHLVLTQVPWKSYEGQNNDVLQLSHPELRWIDYGVVPCSENMLEIDRAPFVPLRQSISTNVHDEVPRIRGGARTKIIMIPPELIEEERIPGPIPPEWGVHLPSLMGLRKIDFCLFPLMPTLTRRVLPPYATPGPEESWTLPLSEVASVKHTMGRIYLWFRTKKIERNSGD